MKINSILFGCLAAVVGYAATLPIAAPAQAAGFSTSCADRGNGVQRCEQKFCWEEGCVVTDVYWMMPDGAIIYQ